MRSLFVALGLIIIMCIASNAQVTIIVNTGPFVTLQKASLAEEEVNFYDDNLADDRACTECFAAMEMFKFLPKATLIKEDGIKFIQPGILPKSGDVFIIGSSLSNPLIKNYPLPEGTKFESEQSYSIRSFKENDRIITIIEGADRIGVLYGVYRYLDELGIKFIGLGEKGTIFPDKPADISDSIKIIENPSYLTRGFYTWGDRNVDREFFLWMARNKFNYWTVQNQPVNFLKKLGVKLSDGGHRVQGVIFNSDDEYSYNHSVFKSDENKPDDPYQAGDEYTGDTNRDGKLSLFEAHPEWFGMKDGKRSKIIYSSNAAQVGINFCTSNVDARKEFAKRIAHQLLNGQWKYVDIFEFWMFDGGPDIWCSCDKCKENGSYTDKMMMVTYDILKELEKMRIAGILNRRVEVSNIAYQATLDPPLGPLPEDYDYKNSSVTFFPIFRCYAHSFADPSCTEVNHRQLQSYQGWTMGEKRFYQGSMFIGEYYNVSSLKSLPVVFTKIMAIDIPWYYRNGARQFHYMHTPDTIWGTWTLNQYLMGQLLWNINADAGGIVENYFNLYYPTTTNTSRKFYEQLEIASANIKAYKHKLGIENDKIFSVNSRLLSGNLFQLDHMHYNEYHPLLNDGPDVEEMMDAMELAGKYLDESLMSCTDLLEQQRLLEDKDRFNYGYAIYRFIYHMIRTSVFHKKGDKIMAVREFAIVEKYAEQLKNITGIVQVSSDHANSPNGFLATMSVEAFNEFLKLYGK